MAVNMFKMRLHSSFPLLMLLLLRHKHSIQQPATLDNSEWCNNENWLVQLLVLTMRSRCPDSATECRLYCDCDLRPPYLHINASLLYMPAY